MLTFVVKQFMFITFWLLYFLNASCGQNIIFYIVGSTIDKDQLVHFVQIYSISIDLCYFDHQILEWWPYSCNHTVCNMNGTHEINHKEQPFSPNNHSQFLGIACMYSPILGMIQFPSFLAQHRKWKETGSMLELGQKPYSLDGRPQHVNREPWKTGLLSQNPVRNYCSECCNELLTYSFNKYFLNSFLWQDTKGGYDAPRSFKQFPAHWIPSFNKLFTQTNSSRAFSDD